MKSHLRGSSLNYSSAIKKTINGDKNINSSCPATVGFTFHPLHMRLSFLQPPLEINQHHTHTLTHIWKLCFPPIAQPTARHEGDQGGGARGSGEGGTPVSHHRLPSILSPAPWLRPDPLRESESPVPSSATSSVHNPQRKNPEKKTKVQNTKIRFSSSFSSSARLRAVAAES